MNPNILLSDRVRVAGAIDPDAYAAGTVTTGWISMATYGSLLAIVMAGTLGSSATLDAKIEEAKDSSGTDAQDLTDKAITQLTQAGTDSDKQALINVRSDELSADFTHVRLSMTVGTATSDAGAVVLGGDARFEPATDAASVDEIVA
ncbi:MAG TPA: hypothetical protein VIG24_17755 [Acidimicrobiia bacterium]